MNSRAREIVAAKGGDWHGHYGKIPGPGHSRRDRSVSIKDSQVLPDGIVVNSFAGDDPLHVKDCLRQEGLLPPLEERSSQKGLETEYIYKQADGTPYLKVTRVGYGSGKRFYQSRWDVAGWRKGAPTGPKIPYRLPEMLGAVHDTVFFVEGEKDADNLARRGFVATTCPAGANGWSRDLVPYFKDKKVFVLPDNDEPGRRYAEQVATDLHGVAESVRVCPLPGLAEKGDVSDWLDNGGDTATLVDFCKGFPEWKPKDTTISAAELQKLDLAPVQLVVPGLIPKGLTILAGKPKIGKSWAVLGLAHALATGGKAFGEIPCNKITVLYAALEDTPARIKDRMETLFGNEPWPVGLLFEFDVPPLDQGGLDKLRQLCARHNIGVLIIDVFQKVRPAKRGGESEYAHDYRSLSMLQKLALELDIAIIVVHHMRKLDAADPLDCVSGTTGLTGAADAIITVSSGADGGHIWAGRGRDIEDFEWPAILKDGVWRILGDAFALTPDQRRVVETLRSAEEPKTPKWVSTISGLKEDSVRQTLRRLAKKGVISCVGYGKYIAPPSLCHSPEKEAVDQRDAA